MKTYTVELVIKAEVEAFDESDAKEIVSDIFGPGDDCGVKIISTNLRQIQEQ